jgi:uncharacterized protein YjbJ (UPF0337 family)
VDQKDNGMKQSIQDRTAGNLHVVTGKVKETVGKITKDPNLESEGTAEKVAGKIQNIVGKIERAVGE